MNIKISSTNPKRKICHLTSVHTPFDIRIFYKECKTLVQAGYEMVILAPHNYDEIFDGIRIRAVPIPKNRIQRMTLTIFYILRAALKENAHLYHLHDPELLLMSFFLRIAGKKVIYDMHENLPKAILSKSWIHILLRRSVAISARLVERFLAVDLPVVYAEHSYVNYYPWVKKYAVVLNMPVTSLMRNIHEEKYPHATLGYIGNVSPERGSIIAIETIHFLKQNGLVLHFECIGQVSDRHRQELLNLCRQYDLDGINVRGHLPPAKSWALVSRCQIGLAILHPVPNYIDSYPTKIFEYMALGLPFITSNFPLYREVIEKEKCGLCVDPLDPEAIAAAIRWITDNPSEARKMGENGRRAVKEKYNWETESTKLLELYDNILNPNDRDTMPAN